jgi:porphobilinogen synthase
MRWSRLPLKKEKGWIDEKRVVLETMLGFKRAGADMILTYHALDVVRWLGDSEVS